MTTPQTARNGDTSAAGWYACFWACFSGWALNAMDVLIFRPALPEIADGLDITKAGLVFVGTSILLTSAVGGWLAGALSDQIGRARTLRIMIVWFALFTALCGFLAMSSTPLYLRNYTVLFSLRTFMGIGFGGQWAAAAILVAETCDKTRRGWWVGLMQSGWALGWAGSELTAKLLQKLASANWLPALFFIGAALALPVLLVSMRARESQYFKETKANLGDKKPDFLEIFSPSMLPAPEISPAARPPSTMLTATFWACMLSIGAQGGYYAILVWLPAFLDKYKLTYDRDLYLAILIGGSFAGYLVSAFSSDLIGRCRNFRWFALLSFATVFAHFVILMNENIPAENTPADAAQIHWGILCMALPLGFFASGAFSGMGAFFTELFPVRVSGSAVGFTYNFGRGFAALLLWLIPWAAGSGQLQIWWRSFLAGLTEILPPELPATPLAKIPDLGLSIGLFILIAYACLFVATLRLRETRGQKDLYTNAA